MRDLQENKVYSVINYTACDKFQAQYENLRNHIATDKTEFLYSHDFYIQEKLDAAKVAVVKKYGDSYVGLRDIRTREDTHG